ncbi:hypothetical protein [Streptomyces sp. NPDC001450]
MMNAELADMRDALVKLRSSVETLRLAEGDSPYVRRLTIDLDRFQLDMEDLSKPASGAGVRRTALLNGSTCARDQDLIRVDDGPYQHLPWQDADDEGIGGHRH